MKRATELEKDLGRWECGELSAEDLEHLHPDSDAAELIATHVQMSVAASVETPPAPETWVAIAGRIAPRRSLIASLRARVQRPVVAGFATAILTTSGAYALDVPGVKDGVDFCRDKVSSLFSSDGPDEIKQEDRSRRDRRDRGRVETPVVGDAQRRDDSSEQEREDGPARDEDRSLEERAEEQRERQQEAREAEEERAEEAAEQAEEAAEEQRERDEEARETEEEAAEEAQDQAEDLADDLEDEREDAADDAADAAEDEADDREDEDDENDD